MSKLMVIALCLVAAAVASPGRPQPDWRDLGWNAHRYGETESSNSKGTLEVHGQVEQGAEVEGSWGASLPVQGAEHSALYGSSGAEGQVGLQDNPQEVHDHHYFHQH